MCSNTKRIFGCAANDFSALTLTYFVINYKFKGISVIKFYVATYIILPLMVVATI